MSGVPRYSHSALKKRFNFKKVDLTVFTESTNNTNNQECLDAQFWRAIFESFFPLKKIDIQPIGSKRTLNDYIDKIKKNGKISNIYIAKDRDYDHVRENKKQLKKYNIIRTYGYSWENDVFTLKATEKRIFENLGITNKKKINNYLLAAHREIKIKLKHAVLLDYAFCVRGSSLFPRGKGNGGIIEIPKSAPPSIDRSKILYYYKEGRLLLNMSTPVPNFPITIVPVKDCYGKLIFSFLFHYFLYVYKALTGHLSGLNRESYSKLALASFKQEISDDKGRLYNHYSFFLQS